MTGTIHQSKREAIHTAYNNCPDKKDLAWKMNWSKEEISQRTTLSDEGRRFPADDPKHDLATFMKSTGDFSYLFTLAAECGFECRLAADRLPENIHKLGSQLDDIQRQFSQMLLMVPLVDSAPAAKRSR